MRAKFIRGQDPKAAMGLGVDGEVLKVGHWGRFSDGRAPIAVSDRLGHEIFSRWADLIDNEFVFSYRGNGEDDEWNVDPEQLSGKTIIYDGKIYSIPEGDIPDITIHRSK